MKLENLTQGKIFKNYREICLELDMPEMKSTNSKKAQFNELARFCKYNKVGHKVIIEEVYDTPLPKIENRGKSEGSRNNNSIYGEFIQLLILDLLAHKKASTLSISRNRLMLAINIINENYGFCSENVRRLSVYTSIDEKVIYDFYNKNNSNFKRMVETALKNLMDKRIIWVDTVTKVAVKNSNIHRLATNEEKEVIMDIEKYTLDELGYKTVSDVRISKDWKKFKKKMKKLLNFQSDINYYYTAYNIIVNDKYMENERKELLEFLMEESTRKEFKGKLNETIINHIITNAEIRHKNGFNSKKMSKIRLNKNYVKDIKQLTDLLINGSTKRFISQMLDDEGVLTSDQLEEIAELFS